MKVSSLAFCSARRQSTASRNALTCRSEGKPQLCLRNQGGRWLLEMLLSLPQEHGEVSCRTTVLRHGASMM